MSWTVIAQRSSTESGPVKYKVTAFHKGDPSALSSEIEINRDKIIEDFQKLLPFISGLRFRSQKLMFENHSAVQLIDSIKENFYSSVDENLKSILDGAEILHIITDDLEMPWELIGLAADNHSIKYSLGISQLSKRRFLRTGLGQEREVNILFVVDTKQNLPQTKIEVQNICSMFDEINKTGKIKVNYLILEGKDATYHNFRKNVIQNYFDIIHVATHTEYDGIVLNDGLLRPTDIFNDVKIGAPWLVFMNSCESAKGVDLDPYEKQGDLSNLTISFLAAGASSYIGTNCIINDSAASEIAVTFYKELLRGLSIGQSLQTSKNTFISLHPDNLSWLAFRLYGDPALLMEIGTINSTQNKSYRVAKIENEASSRDLKSEVIQYLKKNKGKFSIIKCARDLKADAGEIMKILSQI